MLKVKSKKTKTYLVFIFFLICLVGCKNEDVTVKDSNSSDVVTKSTYIEKSKDKTDTSFSKESNDIKEKYTKKAEADIELINNGKNEDLENQFSEKMKEAGSDNDITEEIQIPIEQAGEFERFESTKVVLHEDNYITTTTVKYSEETYKITISYDSTNGQIIDLFIE